MQIFAVALLGNTSCLLVLGFYYGVLSGFPLGVSQIWCLRSLLAECYTRELNSTKLDTSSPKLVWTPQVPFATLGGFFSAQALVSVSMYYSPIYVFWSQPYLALGVSALYVYCYIQNTHFNLMLNTFESIEHNHKWKVITPLGLTMDMDQKIVFSFVHSFLLQLMNPAIISNASFSRLLSVALFRHNQNIVFLMGSVIGWMSGQFIFLTCIYTLFFRLQHYFPIIYAYTRVWISQMLYLVLFSIWLSLFANSRLFNNNKRVHEGMFELPIIQSMKHAKTSKSLKKVAVKGRPIMFRIFDYYRIPISTKKHEYRNTAKNRRKGSPYFYELTLENHFSFLTSSANVPEFQWIYGLRGLTGVSGFIEHLFRTFSNLFITFSPLRRPYTFSPHLFQVFITGGKLKLSYSAQHTFMLLTYAINDISQPHMPAFLKTTPAEPTSIDNFALKRVYFELYYKLLRRQFMVRPKVDSASVFVEHKTMSLDYTGNQLSSHIDPRLNNRNHGLICSRFTYHDTIPFTAFDVSKDVKDGIKFVPHLCRSNNVLNPFKIIDSRCLGPNIKSITHLGLPNLDLNRPIALSRKKQKRMVSFRRVMINKAINRLTKRYAVQPSFLYERVLSPVDTNALIVPGYRLPRSHFLRGFKVFQLLSAGVKSIPTLSELKLSISKEIILRNMAKEVSRSRDHWVYHALNAYPLIFFAQFRKWVRLPLLILVKDLGRRLLLQQSELNEDFKAFIKERYVYVSYDLQSSDLKIPSGVFLNGIQIKVYSPCCLTPWRPSKLMSLRQPVSVLWYSTKLDYSFREDRYESPLFRSYEDVFLLQSGEIAPYPFGIRKALPLFWRPVLMGLQIMINQHIMYPIMMKTAMIYPRFVSKLDKFLEPVRNTLNVMSNVIQFSSSNVASTADQAQPIIELPQDEHLHKQTKHGLMSFLVNSVLLRFTSDNNQVVEVDKVQYFTQRFIKPIVHYNQIDLDHIYQSSVLFRTPLFGRPFVINGLQVITSFKIRLISHESKINISCKLFQLESRLLQFYMTWLGWLEWIEWAEFPLAKHENTPILKNEDYTNRKDEYESNTPLSLSDSIRVVQKSRHEFEVNFANSVWNGKWYLELERNFIDQLIHIFRNGLLVCDNFYWLYVEATQTNTDHLTPKSTHLSTTYMLHKLWQSKITSAFNISHITKHWGPNESLQRRFKYILQHHGMVPVAHGYDTLTEHSFDQWIAHIKSYTPSLQLWLKITPQLVKDYIIEFEHNHNHPTVRDLYLTNYTASKVNAEVADILPIMLQKASKLVKRWKFNLLSQSYIEYLDSIEPIESQQRRKKEYTSMLKDHKYELNDNRKESQIQTEDDTIITQFHNRQFGETRTRKGRVIPYGSSVFKPYSIIDDLHIKQANSGKYEIQRCPYRGYMLSSYQVYFPLSTIAVEKAKIPKEIPRLHKYHKPIISELMLTFTEPGKNISQIVCSTLYKYNSNENYDDFTFVTYRGIETDIEWFNHNRDEPQLMVEQIPSINNINIGELSTIIYEPSIPGRMELKEEYPEELLLPPRKKTRHRNTITDILLSKQIVVAIEVLRTQEVLSVEKLNFMTEKLIENIVMLYESVNNNSNSFNKTKYDNLVMKFNNTTQEEINPAIQSKQNKLIPKMLQAVNELHQNGVLQGMREEAVQRTLRMIDHNAFESTFQTLKGVTFKGFGKRRLFQILTKGAHPKPSFVPIRTRLIHKNNIERLGVRRYSKRPYLIKEPAFVRSIVKPMCYPLHKEPNDYTMTLWKWLVNASNMYIRTSRTNVIPESVLLPSTVRQLRVLQSYNTVSKRWLSLQTPHSNMTRIRSYEIKDAKLAIQKEEDLIYRSSSIRTRIAIRKMTSSERADFRELQLKRKRKADEKLERIRLLNTSYRVIQRSLWSKRRLEDLACINRFWLGSATQSRFSQLRIRMYPWLSR